MNCGVGNIFVILHYSVVLQCQVVEIKTKCNFNNHSQYFRYQSKSPGVALANPSGWATILWKIRSPPVFAPTIARPKPALTSTWPDWVRMIGKFSRIFYSSPPWIGYGNAQYSHFAKDCRDSCRSLWSRLLLTIAGFFGDTFRSRL